MCAIVTNKGNRYQVTVNGISVNFQSIVNVVNYAKMMKFNLTWEL